MSPLAPLPRLPLARQVAVRMREAIKEGTWRDVLPGERHLSLQMEVSRPVIREALQQLVEEGLIDCEPNRSRRIIATDGGAGTERRIQRRVLLLFGSDQQDTMDDAFFFSMINAFERRRMEVEVRPHGAVYALHRAGFFRDETVSILLSVPERTQRWYARNGYPALVSGSVYPGIALPSVDVDTRAVARHAVGNLLRLGHRRVACISSDRPRAGDLESEEGFQEAMAVRPDSTALLTRTRLEPTEVSRHLRRLLKMDEPPTALFICHAQVALVAASYAAGVGVRVPEQLSIICRDYSSYLPFHIPGVASYASDQDAAIRQLMRWVQTPPKGPDRKRLQARFLPGGSLSQAPAA